MKRILSAVLILLLVSAGQLWAVGSCTQATTENYQGNGLRRVFFLCTGDSANGSIPNTATSTANTAFISGWQLFQVDAYPTAGGTAPDAADVLILDATGKDLLGSVDGSTAYGGLNLIHATLSKSTVPDIYLTGTTSHAYYFPYVTGALTLKVNNQATASAKYTVVLNFYKDR